MVQSFTAIEAIGWLWREAEAAGFAPAVHQTRRMADLAGVIAGAAALIGLVVWGLLELVR